MTRTRSKVIAYGDGSIKKPFECDTIVQLHEAAYKWLKDSEEPIMYALLHDYEPFSDGIKTVEFSRVDPPATWMEWNRARVFIHESHWQHGIKELKIEIPWNSESKETRLVKLARLCERFDHVSWVPQDDNAS